MLCRSIHFNRHFLLLFWFILLDLTIFGLAPFCKRLVHSVRQKVEKLLGHGGVQRIAKSHLYFVVNFALGVTYVVYFPETIQLLKYLTFRRTHTQYLPGLNICYFAFVFELKLFKANLRNCLKLPRRCRIL